MPNPGNRTNHPEKLWSKVDRRGEDECWPFTGWKKVSGYGNVKYKGKSMSAHRLAFILANSNERIDGLEVMHLCHNPSCCNPKHLKLGTRLENVQQSVERNPTGIRIGLTWKDISDIVNSPCSARSLAKKYSTNHVTIGNIRRCYEHIRQPVDHSQEATHV